MSADGNVVAYVSRYEGQVRARDRAAGTTVGVASLATDVSLSPSGRYVAFASSMAGPTGVYGVYRYDLATSTLARLDGTRVTTGTGYSHAGTRVTDAGRVVWLEEDEGSTAPPGVTPCWMSTGIIVWSDGGAAFDWDPGLAVCALDYGREFIDTDAAGDRVVVWAWATGSSTTGAGVFSISAKQGLTSVSYGDGEAGYALSGDGQWLVTSRQSGGGSPFGGTDGALTFYEIDTEEYSYVGADVDGSGAEMPRCLGDSMDLNHDGSVVTCRQNVVDERFFVIQRDSGRTQAVSPAGPVAYDRAAISADGRTVAYDHPNGLYVNDTTLVDLPLPEPSGNPADDEDEGFGLNPAERYQCPCQGFAADPVDTRGGNMNLPLPGLGIPGRGPGLGFDLAYNSMKHDIGSSVGAGFDFSYGMRIDQEGEGSIAVRQEAGSVLRFYPVGGRRWAPAGRFVASLEQAGDGTWTLTRNHFEVFRFDHSGRLTSQRDLNGYETKVVYTTGTDEIAYVEEQIGSPKRRLTFSYTGGKVDTITDPAGRVVDFGYTGDHLTTYTDVTGGVWSFGYDSAGRVEWWRKPANQPSGPRMEVGYDSAGRVAWQTDELDREWTFAYDTPAAGATSVTEPDGDVRVDWYTDGRREKVTHAYGTADAYEVTYTYDPDTNAPLTMTDRGRTTTYSYDAVGNRISTTDPTGRQTKATYNARDQVVRAEVNRAKPGDPADWVVTQLDYDLNGNLIKTTEDLGGADEAITELKRTDTTHPDDVRQVVDARGKTWAFEYHASRGDRTKATDPLGNVTTWVTNTIGLVTSTVAPEGNRAGGTPAHYTTTFTYDAVGRLERVTNPVGDITETAYDAASRVVESRTDLGTGDTDPELTLYDYDAAGQLLEVVEASKVGSTVTPLSTTTYDYWLDGARKSWTNGNGQQWSYGYDHANRLVSEIDPNGEATCYTFDSAGDLATVIRPDAGPECTAGTRPATVSYGYDGAGRPTSVNYTDPATPDIGSITYDGAGRRLTATVAGGGAESWTWDRRGRLTGQTDPNGRTTGYGWDETSNLTTLTYPGGVGSVTRGYDDAGRWTSVTDWTGDTTSFGYDRNGSWLTTTFPAPTGNVDTRTYDRAGQLASISWADDSTTLGALTYTRTGGGGAARDDDGLVDVVTATGAAGANRDYGYDGRDQLTDPGTSGAALALDPAGNLTETEDGRLQVFDPAQQLCWTSPTATTGTCATPPTDATTFGSDARGNRTWAAPPTGGATRYSYDAADRLTRVDLPSTGTEGQFETVISSRVADTRTGVGVCDGGTCSVLAANQTVKIQVTGRGNIPATGVAAVTGNVTVPNPSTTGYIRANPSGTAAAGTLNYRTGISTSGFMVLPVASDGTVTVWASAAAHVVLDLSGYYTDATATGDTYEPLTAARLVDTRSGTATGVCNSGTCSTLTSGSSTVVDVAGRAGVPGSGATAVVLSATVLTPSARAALQFQATTGQVALNFMIGETGNDTLVVPLSSTGKITLSMGSANADVIVDVAGYYTAPPPGGDGSLQLVPTTREIDTTDGTGTCDPGPCDRLGVGDRVEVQLAGTAGVPATASAVLVWVSALDPTVTGELRLNPDGTTGAGTTGAATITFQAGHDTDALALVPVGPDGLVTVGTSQAIDVTIDVIGYVGQASDTWTYRYDSTGLRTTKAAPGGAATGFTWDRASGLPMVLAQHDGTDVTYLIYGPGGLPVKEINPDGSEIWYHQDHLGSTRLTTTSSGAEHARYAYDAYGTKTTDTTGSGASRPLLTYAGQYTDPETGLQYLRARYYDPTTAQFLTRDPLIHQTQQPYSYAAGDPINGSDPTGLCGLTDPMGCLDPLIPGGANQQPQSSHPATAIGQGLINQIETHANQTYDAIANSGFGHFVSSCSPGSSWSDNAEVADCIAGSSAVLGIAVGPVESLCGAFGALMCLGVANAVGVVASGVGLYASIAGAIMHGCAGEGSEQEESLRGVGFGLFGVTIGAIPSPYTPLIMSYAGLILLLWDSQ